MCLEQPLRIVLHVFKLFSRVKVDDTKIAVKYPPDIKALFYILTADIMKKISRWY